MCPATSGEKELSWFPGCDVRPSSHGRRNRLQPSQMHVAFSLAANAALRTRSHRTQLLAVDLLLLEMLRFLHTLT